MGGDWEERVSGGRGRRREEGEGDEVCRRPVSSAHLRIDSSFSACRNGLLITCLVRLQQFSLVENQHIFFRSCKHSVKSRYSALSCMTASTHLLLALTFGVYSATFAVHTFNVHTYKRASVKPACISAEVPLEEEHPEANSCLGKVSL